MRMPCRNTIQNVGNILGALYLSMLFLGIINSRTVQPVAAAERAVSASSCDASPAALLSGSNQLSVFPGVT